MIDAVLTQIIYRTRLSVVFSACLVVVGLLQWIWARLSDQPLEASTWGEAALAFPLELWAIFMTLGSLMVFLGLLYPPHARIVRFGCLIQIAHISYLGFSAAITGGDPVIAAFAFTVLVPVHLFLALRAGHDD